MSKIALQMKKELLILLFVLFSSFIFSQNNVGIGTATPNSKAKLDIFATDAGLLIPRLSTAQRLALLPNATDEGLMVYDITEHLFFYWDNAQWQPFPDKDWIIVGNDQYSGVPNNVGIGVTTPQAKLHTLGTLRFEALLAGLDSNVLVVDANGNVATRLLPANIWDGDDVGIVNIVAGNALISNTIGNAITLDVQALNGLYVDNVADAIKLGGNLVQNTQIDLGNFNLIQNLNGTGHFEVQNNGNTTLIVDNNANVGVNTTSPNPQAIVDINSTTKGILFPRMTTAQRNAIAAPTLGLIIYNVEDSVAQHFNGQCWLPMYLNDCNTCDFDLTLSDTLGIIDKIFTDSTTVTISVNQTMGNPNTAISVFYMQNLPVGTSTSLSNYIINGAGTTTLTIKADIFTTPGLYPIAIQAMCGSTVKIKVFKVQIDSCYKVFVSSSLTDYDLQLINSLPTNVPICVIAKVQTNGKLYGDTNAAFHSGALHPQSHVGLINYGEIYGFGGDGGGLAAFNGAGVAGGNGGHAINLTTKTTLLNNGYIFGGGAGGGSIGVGTSFTIPFVGTYNVGVGVGGGGGAPDGIGGGGTAPTIGLFSAGQNGTGGLNGAGGAGGNLNVPIPIPLGPLTFTITPSGNGGNGGGYGIDGTAGTIAFSVGVSVPIVGTINFGPYTAPIGGIPPGGIGGNAIKRNGNLLINLPDANYQTFQIRGVVGP